MAMTGDVAKGAVEGGEFYICRRNRRSRGEAFWPFHVTSRG